MVLAQKQTCGSMEQNREPRNKPIHLQLISTEEVRIYSGEQSLQQLVLGK